MSRHAKLAQQVTSEVPVPLSTIQPCALISHDERFQLIDRLTGHPLAGARYRIEGLTNIWEGRTDELGRTSRINTGEKAQRLRVFHVEEEAAIEGASADADPCF